jgi:NADH dehydrogenase
MGAVGQIQPVQANLRFPDSVRRAVEGAQAVVNLVGILAKAGPQTFQAVHVEGARAVANAARDAGARTLVHVSALGADRRAKSNYARTKAAGEAAVLQAFPGAAILRPSLVFGPEDQLFNRFAEMARMSPLLPLIGGGRNKMQPVYAGNVGSAIADACGGKAVPGSIYELGGPEVVTFRQLLDRVQTWSGRKRHYLRLPFWAAKLGAMLTTPLPNSLRPLTVDQIRMLQSDNSSVSSRTDSSRTTAADRPTPIGPQQPCLSYPRSRPYAGGSSPCCAGGASSTWSSGGRIFAFRCLNILPNGSRDALSNRSIGGRSTFSSTWTRARCWPCTWA